MSASRNRPGGLGRGLDALLGAGFDPGQDNGAHAPEIRMLPLAAIRANPDQPRTVFTKEALDDLTESIRTQGVLQPILVRPKRGQGGQRYEIVAGERRFRAAGQAGLAEIPALVKDMSEDESLAVALIENLQREDLNPVEEARGLRELQERLGVSQEELAKRVGKSRSAVANTLRLLALPSAALQDVEAGRMSAGHGRALMAVTDETLREELRQRILAESLNVREAEGLAQCVRLEGSLPEPAVADGPAKPAGQRKAQGRRAPDPELKAIAERLSKNLGARVRCTGSTGRGSISVSFASQEELTRILNLLSELGGQS